MPLRRALRRGRPGDLRVLGGRSLRGREQTIAGVSVLRFGADGLVVFERDYWAVEVGRSEPPGRWDR